MWNLTFAENLKYLRELDGLKQAEMLNSTGFKQSTWNGYERGASTPSLEDLIKISDYFGILESDILRTEIPESDLQKLYNIYIYQQEVPENIGSTPHSKTFLTYFNSLIKAIPPAKSRGSVTQNVTKPVTITPKKEEKPFPYTPLRALDDSSILGESEPKYHTPAKRTDRARIARLEAIVGALKDVLDQYL